MVKISIDLPITLICISEIQLNPLKDDAIIISEQEKKFCLSLVVLLIPYGYLLYNYIRSLQIISSKDLRHELDELDISITTVSIIRLAVLFLFLIMEHQTGIIIMSIFGFIWEFILMLIYTKFVIQNRKKWLYFLAISTFLYILYAIILNIIKRSANQDPITYFRQNTIIIPLFYSNIIITIFITIIGINEFISIEKALVESILTSTITIQLKNRRSFIFLTVVACWISLIMRRFPEIFRPILGVVLYFLLCQWINMAILYKCVINRIVKSNQQEESSQQSSNDYRGKINSNLILIQMQNYSKN